MHTDTTQEEKPTGCANNPAGHTDRTTVSGPISGFKSRLIGFALWLAEVFKGVA